MTEKVSQMLDSIKEALGNRNREKDSETADVWVTLFRAAIEELIGEGGDRYQEEAKRWLRQQSNTG